MSWENTLLKLLNPALDDNEDYEEVIDDLIVKLEFLIEWETGLFLDDKTNIWSHKNEKGKTIPPIGISTMNVRTHAGQRRRNYKNSIGHLKNLKHRLNTGTKEYKWYTEKGFTANTGDEKE